MQRLDLLGTMRVKLTNMLSIFVDSLGQASNFQSIVINGCSPAVNLISPACLGKCQVPDGEMDRPGHGVVNTAAGQETA